jgi:tryptophan synthase alpha chain
MKRIDALFRHVRSQKRPAFMPFLTAGDPDVPTTQALLREFFKSGSADMVELGIPYSDPIADGPVITASYTRALRQGIKLDHILDMIKQWRMDESMSGAPVVTMVSYAIVHRHGVAQYLDAAVAAGVDGLIVPDLPVEEAEGREGLRAKADAAGLALVQLVTPTTPRDRAVRIARSSSGFLYYVSVAGITGERRALPPELVDNVAWLRTQTELPICIGFGISTPEHVRQLAPVADGLIVGSAIVRRIAELAEQGGAGSTSLVTDVGEFVATLAAACRSST